MTLTKSHTKEKNEFLGVSPSFSYVPIMGTFQSPRGAYLVFITLEMCVSDSLYSHFQVIAPRSSLHLNSPPTGV
jgi:hypothetical protein